MLEAPALSPRIANVFQPTVVGACAVHHVWIEALGRSRQRRLCRRGRIGPADEVLLSCRIGYESRLSIAPEPLLLKTLREPEAHNGAYSTVDAEAAITADSIRGMMSGIHACRGVHTLKLVRLRYKNTSCGRQVLDTSCRVWGLRVTWQLRKRRDRCGGCARHSGHASRFSVARSSSAFLSI